MGTGPSGALTLDLSNRNLDSLTPNLVAMSDKMNEIDLSNNLIRVLPPDMPNLRKLSLAKNKLTENDNQVWKILRRYSHIMELSLAENEISLFGDLLLGLSTLKRLDLSRNGLSSVTISNSDLEEINLASNFLCEFPQQLPPNLKEINLNFNRIDHLNFASEKLTVLSLAMNGLVTFSESLHLPNLIKLELSKNDLMKLPNLKQVAPKLQSLDVSENLLEKLPDLPNTLRDLKASRNKLLYVINFAKETPKLEELDLSYNKLQTLGELPASIVKINATHNCIKEVSTCTANKLKRLDLSNNCLTEPPHFDGNKLLFANISTNQLVSLDGFVFSDCLIHFKANENNITKIPVPLLSLESLTHLELCTNEIDVIPEEIANSRIQFLNLSMNPITSIPILPKTLRCLYIASCGLTKLPETISANSALTELVVSNNELEEIPLITSLEILRASRNKLKLFPKTGGNEKTIDVSHNNITAFRKVFCCGLIVDMDISFNQLKRLPIGILKCKYLESLDMSFNKMTANASFAPCERLSRIGTMGLDITIGPSPATKIILTNGGEIPVQEGEQAGVNRIATSDAVGISETIGKRDAMEDVVIARENGNLSTFAIFDGHRGDASSVYGSYEYAKLFYERGRMDSCFMDMAFRHISDKLREKELGDGSTAAICMVSKSQVIVGNIGDSRVLIIDTEGNVAFSTTDHKPVNRDEIHRVLSIGGSITDMRLDGRLGVTRSISDFNVHGILRDPDVTQRKIEATDKWLILGCDGVFDVLSSEKIGAMSLKAECARHFAVDIRNTAYYMGSTDNISVVAVDLQQLIAGKEDDEFSSSSD